MESKSKVESNGELETFNEEEVNQSTESEDSDSGLELTEKEKLYNTLRQHVEDDQDDKETEDISDGDFINLLIRADIQPDWIVPELHKLTRNLRSSLSEESKKTIADLNLPYRAGVFTPGEDKILRRNWNAMCRIYKLPNCPVIFGRYRNISNKKKSLMARRRVLIYLGKGLEHRTLAQIYARFKTSLGCTKKGRFTDVEKEAIELFLSHRESIQELSQVFLSSILGRDKQSIWRYLQLRSREEKQSIKWELKSVEKFLLVLLKHVNTENEITPNSKDLRVLRGKKVSWEIWKRVGDEMDAHALHLKVFWISKLYVQLFAEKPIYLRELKTKLVKVLTREKYVYWQDIDWTHVSKEFDNCTSLFLFKIFHLWVKETCFDLRENVQNCVKFLHEKIKEGNMKNKKLRRLRFDKNGKLAFID